LNPPNNISLFTARSGMKVPRLTTADNGMKIHSIPRIVVQNDSTEYILILDSKNRGSTRVWIRGSITILAAKSLHKDRETEIIRFELQTRLSRIKPGAFSFSLLNSIEIPRNVQITASSCFSYRKSLPSISFESNSRLIRIESGAFSFLSLQWTESPRDIRFIDGSALIGSELYYISIEAGHDRFIIENDFRITIVDYRLIRDFSRSSHIEIMNTIEIIGSLCFSGCDSLSSISLGSNSQLEPIEATALSRLND
jgi:hypothetical protein